MSIQKINSNTLADGAALNSIPGGVNFRNRIINGDMRIDQRNAGASVSLSVDNVFAVDRFTTNYSSAIGATLTIQQVSDAPPGYNNSYRLSVTAGVTSSGTQVATLRQNIEGLNVYDLNFGSSSAQAVTVSFWVKCSLTGVFGGSLMNDGFNRSYPFSYTIQSANTWEYKTITIPGDTTGTWLKNNGRGILLQFDWGSGPDRLGSAGSWSPTRLHGVTGQTNIIATTGATWQITGVQLEAGSVATPFERRPYGMELALCQRYYQIVRSTYETSLGTTGNIAAPTVTFSTPMRASPTITASLQNDGSSATIAAFGINGSASTGFYSFQMTLTVSTTGYAYRYMRGPADAEL
jgi:hypothetical protein